FLAPPSIGPDTLSLPDALPISRHPQPRPAPPPLLPVHARPAPRLVQSGRQPPALPPATPGRAPAVRATARPRRTPAPAMPPAPADRKSTRLNSSHVKSSYAVFC